MNFHDTIAGKGFFRREGSRLSAAASIESVLRIAFRIVRRCVMCLYLLDSYTAFSKTSSDDADSNTSSDRSVALPSSLTDLWNPALQVWRGFELNLRFASLDALFEEEAATDFQSQLEASEFQVESRSYYQDGAVVLVAGVLYGERLYSNSSIARVNGNRFLSSSYQSFTERSAYATVHLALVSDLWVGLGGEWLQSRQNNRSLFGSSAGRAEDWRSDLHLAYARKSFWIRARYQPQIRRIEAKLSVRRPATWDLQMAMFLTNAILLAGEAKLEQRSQLDSRLKDRREFALITERLILNDLIWIAHLRYRPSSESQRRGLEFDSLSLTSLQLGLDWQAYQDASLGVSWQISQGEGSESAEQRRLSVLAHSVEVISRYQF